MISNFCLLSCSTAIFCSFTLLHLQSLFSLVQRSVAKIYRRRCQHRFPVQTCSPRSQFYLYDLHLFIWKVVMKLSTHTGFCLVSLQLHCYDLFYWTLITFGQLIFASIAYIGFNSFMYSLKCCLFWTDYFIGKLKYIYFWLYYFSILSGFKAL